MAVLVQLGDVCSFICSIRDTALGFMFNICSIFSVSAWKEL